MRATAEAPRIQGSIRSGLPRSRSCWTACWLTPDSSKLAPTALMLTVPGSLGSSTV